MLTEHLSFLVTVIKYHDQGNILQSYLANSPKEIIFHDGRRDVASKQQAVEGLVKKNHILKQIGSREWTRKGKWPLKPQILAPDTSSRESTFLKPPQTGLPIGNQVFKCSGLTVASHSNHHAEFSKF